jgi:hypothetical protein
MSVSSFPSRPQPNAVDPLAVVKDVLASLILIHRPGCPVGELPLSDAVSAPGLFPLRRRSQALGMPSRVRMIRTARSVWPKKVRSQTE